MPPAKRRVVAAQTQEVPYAQEAPVPKRRVGRPPGEVSTIVNVRLPLSLVARLDRYLARLEQQTGLKANRGMMARHALELFLLSHEDAASPSKRARRQPRPDAPFVPVRKRRTSARPKVQ
jgi:hypothetical protein